MAHADDPRRAYNKVAYEKDSQTRLVGLTEAQYHATMALLESNQQLLAALNKRL